MPLIQRPLTRSQSRLREASNHSAIATAPVHHRTAPDRRNLRRRVSSINAFRGAENLEGILLFKEQPRQFLLLFLVLASVSYYSYSHHTTDFVQNVKSALLSGSLIFLVYCFLQTRDTLLLRPHPGVWRIVHGCGVLYLIVLAALSVQNLQSARQVLRVLWPEVGERSGVDMSHLECEITPSVSPFIDEFDL